MMLRNRIGQEVEVRFAGKRVTGVVTDVDQIYDQHGFDPQLKISTGSGATLSVSPDDVIEVQS